VREMTDAEVEKHFPVQGWRMKCGLRTDLPKKERVHDYVTLGPEQRNSGTARGYIHGTAYACARCGADRFRAWKGPKTVTVVKRAGSKIEVRDSKGKELMSIADTAEYQLEQLAESINELRQPVLRIVQAVGEDGSTRGYLRALSDIASVMGLTVNPDNGEVKYL